MPEIAIKRVYEEPSAEDGYRVLVDRLWPRGLSRDRARLDEWAKDLAPSSELRRWFAHDPQRWQAFARRYRRELEDRQETLDRLLQACGDRRLTLLFSARDEKHNQAVILAEVLRERA